MVHIFALTHGGLIFAQMSFFSRKKSAVYSSVVVMAMLLLLVLATILTTDPLTPFLAKALLIEFLANKGLISGFDPGLWIRMILLVTFGLLPDDGAWGLLLLLPCFLPTMAQFIGVAVDVAPFAAIAAIDLSFVFWYWD